MNKSLLIVTVVLTFGCSTKRSTTATDNDSADVKISADTFSGQSKGDSIILSRVVNHVFSSPNSEDTFGIKLTGHSIIDGTVEFKIVARSGLVIFYETYPSRFLIGYGLDDKATEIEKADYIRARVLNFFEEEKFRSPAIEKDEEFEEDYSNRAIWDDIKSDTTAVRFGFLIGEESHRQIAYSKKMRKVVTIFGCC